MWIGPQGILRAIAARSCAVCGSATGEALMWWFGSKGMSRGANSSQEILGRLFSRPRARSRKRGFEQRYCRSLKFDRLEVRNLLSVTPADLTAVIVNQTYGATQTTTTAHSVASDNAGDFVVTWARADSLLDSNGNPILNVTTGLPYQVQDVYARYYTDTVERITLPGPGTQNNNGQTLLNGIATNFD